MTIMNIKQLSVAAAVSALIFTTATNAVLGPIPIYLNTEYRTSNPVIGSIASTIKLNKEQIQASGANTFTELLATIQGVAFEGGSGNLTSLRIRGNKPSHTLLLVDGSKVSITATQPNFDVIPLDQIERIEISKGPFTSLYGPGAIGGVIHVFTNRETKEGELTTLSASYGTHNSKKISISSRINNNGNYINYSLSKYKTDGIDSRSDNIGGNEEDSDSIDRVSGGLNIGYSFSKDANIKFNILKTDATINYDKQSIYDTLKPDNNLFQYNFELNQSISNIHKLKINYAKQETQRRSDKYKLVTKSLVNEFNTRNNKLIIGIVDVVDKDVGNNAQIKHTDVFTQWQGSIKGNELSVGSRIIDHDTFSRHNTFNLNWAKSINPNIRMVASYGKATNLPNHYQNKLNTLNNYDSTKPEQSHSYELGGDLITTLGIINVKIYNTKVSNTFIYTDPDGSGTDAFIDINSDGYDDNAYYGNGGNTNIHGFEISTKTALLNWDINSYYDYNKSIDKTTGSKYNFQKGRVPHHSASITATKKLGKYKHRINLIGKSWAWDKDDHSTGKLGGYGLLNLSTSYTYNNKISVSVKLNNTLDKKYTVAEPYNTLGRVITLGIVQKF